MLFCKRQRSRPGWGFSGYLATLPANPPPFLSQAKLTCKVSGQMHFPAWVLPPPSPPSSGLQQQPPLLPPFLPLQQIQQAQFPPPPPLPQVFSVSSASLWGARLSGSRSSSPPRPWQGAFPSLRGPRLHLPACAAPGLQLASRGPEVRACSHPPTSRSHADVGGLGKPGEWRHLVAVLCQGVHHGYKRSDGGSPACHKQRKGRKKTDASSCRTPFPAAAL